MERLTERNKNSLAMAACCGKACEYNYVCEVGGFGECRRMDDIIDRLADIEDILGDDYDLDRLRKIVSIIKAIPHTCNYCIGCELEPKDGHGCDGYDSFVLSTKRLRELVEAGRDGRCVILPPGGYADKDGENALKSAMNTCFYHNNPVTRYIADAVAEKLTREAAEAALKGDQHGV